MYTTEYFLQRLNLLMPETAAPSLLIKLISLSSRRGQWCCYSHLYVRCTDNEILLFYRVHSPDLSHKAKHLKQNLTRKPNSDPLSTADLRRR